MSPKGFEDRYGVNTAEALAKAAAGSERGVETGNFINLNEERLLLSATFPEDINEVLRYGVVHGQHVEQARALQRRAQFLSIKKQLENDFKKDPTPELSDRIISKAKTARFLYNEVMEVYNHYKNQSATESSVPTESAASDTEDQTDYEQLTDWATHNNNVDTNQTEAVNDQTGGDAKAELDQQKTIEQLGGTLPTETVMENAVPVKSDPLVLTSDMRVDNKSEEYVPKPDWQPVAEALGNDVPEVQKVEGPEGNELVDTNESLESLREHDVLGMALPPSGPEYIYAARSFREGIKLHLHRYEGEQKELLEKILSEVGYVPDSGLTATKQAELVRLAQQFNAQLAAESATNQSESLAYTPEEAAGLMAAVDQVFEDQQEKPSDTKRTGLLQRLFGKRTSATAVEKIEDSEDGEKKRKTSFWARLFGRSTKNTERQVAQTKLERRLQRGVDAGSNGLNLAVLLLAALPWFSDASEEDRGPQFEPLTPTATERYEPNQGVTPGNEIPRVTTDPASETITDPSDATYEINDTETESESLYDIERINYTVQAGDRGLTYVLRERYPDVFPTEGDSAWEPVVHAWQNSAELLQAAHFPNADLDKIYPNDQIQLDKFVEHYLEHFAPPEVRDRYRR